MSNQNFSRRDFISKCCQCAAGAAILIPISNSVMAADSTSTAKTPVSLTLDLTKAEFKDLAKVGGAVKIPDPNNDKQPLIVVRLSETEVAAFSSKCTHKGCEVGMPDNAGVITCPCHKAKFDSMGMVKAGPAKENLKSYYALLNKSTITISDTKK